MTTFHHETQRIVQLDCSLVIYDALNINVRKSNALCTNSTSDLLHNLQQKGFNIADIMRHLGIELRGTIEITLRETFQKIKLKSVTHRILATTPHTDILHGTTPVNSAMVLLLACPDGPSGHWRWPFPSTQRDYIPPLDEKGWGRNCSKKTICGLKATFCVFWQRRVTNTISPKAAEDLWLNRIQEYFWVLTLGDSTHFPRIIETMLNVKGDLASCFQSISISKVQQNGQKQGTKSCPKTKC
jgi:hypothetical protein